MKAHLLLLIATAAVGAPAPAEDRRRRPQPLPEFDPSPELPLPRQGRLTLKEGEDLRTLRLQAGLKLREASARVMLPYDTLRRAEAGQVTLSAVQMDRILWVYQDMRGVR